MTINLSHKDFPRKWWNYSHTFSYSGRNIISYNLMIATQIIEFFCKQGIDDNMKIDSWFWTQLKFIQLNVFGNFLRLSCVQLINWKCHFLNQFDGLCLSVCCASTRSDVMHGIYDWKMQHCFFAVSVTLLQLDPCVSTCQKGSAYTWFQDNEYGIISLILLSELIKYWTLKTKLIYWLVGVWYELWFSLHNVFDWSSDPIVINNSFVINCTKYTFSNNISLHMRW